MNFRLRASASVALAAAVVYLATAALVRPLAAQTPRDRSRETERLEVRGVELHGVHAVSAKELKESLATKASSCLSLLFAPLCLFTKSPYVYEHRYFDPLEFRRDVLRVLVFYYKRGWRDAQVDTTVTRDGSDVRVRFDVVEGPPTVVDTVVVAGLRGIVRQPGRRRADRRLIRPGEPLNLLRLDTAVVRIRAALLDRGYGNAVVEAPKIVEDTAAHRARVEIAATPGTLTPIKRVDVVRLSAKREVSDQTIRNSLTFEPGDLLRRRRIAESQRALYESGLFRSALIDTAVATDAANGRTVCAAQGTGSAPRPTAAAVAAGQGAPGDSAKNVVVCVLEGQLRYTRVGVGFTTADFFAVQGVYTDNYFAHGPRRFTLTGQLGNLLAQQLNGKGTFIDIFKGIPANQQDARFFAPTFQVGADVRQRWFLSPRNTFGGGLFGHRRSSPGVFVDRGYGANLVFTRNVTSQVPLSAAYRFEINRVEAGDVYFCVSFGTCDAATIGALQGQQRLSPVALTGTITTADSPLEPTQGWIGRAEIEHASQATLSDYRYNRAFGTGATYLRLPFRRAVLAFRGQAGWVKGLSSTNGAVGVPDGNPILHPSKRFYAGGSQSVRGYGENALGPRVVTIDPNQVTGRSGPSDAPKFACPATTASQFAACFAQRGDSIGDKEFVERPLGGTTLLMGSVEMRLPIWGPLLGALFVDGAILGERTLGDFDHSTKAVTPGFGIRYLSPVGPVRVDVGYKPKLSEALPVYTQITDSTGNHLVDLTNGKGCTATSTAADGCRIFPLRESASAFRRFLDRLVLHLSIGEAF